MRVLITVFGLVLIFTSQVFAADVHVEQKSQGTKTVCINGKCETTGGESYSKVCVDGECQESTDGNINIDKDGTHVKINSSTGSNSVSVSSTGNNPTDLVNTDDSITGEPENPTPTATSSGEDSKDTDEKENSDQEEEQKRFFETLIELLKKLLPFF